MKWDELEGDFKQQDTSYLNFDTLSLISKPRDYYRILEVDYEASEYEIRSNFIRLALKWHPDKQKGEDSATSKFQEINEAYQGFTHDRHGEERKRRNDGKKFQNLRRVRSTERMLEQILEAPTLPAMKRMKRSTPQVPEFQEFHLEIMERANQNAETSTVASTETAAPPIHQWKPRLTTPKTPPLQTLLRARPPTIKTTDEIEQEELEKAVKFKARPLNKKIFESKGELGLPCNKKRQVTIQQEFHFAIDERIPPPATNLADMLIRFPQPETDS